ncbi:MAG: outer membrane lipoprotein chaperone LolA [Cellvibrionaceae bacterium]
MSIDTLISLSRRVVKAKRGSVTVLAISLLCLTVSVGAENTVKDSALVIESAVTEDDAAIRLVETLTPLQSLAGSFDQRQTGAEGELLSESSGEFKMQRPGLLRWQTVEPFPQLLVTDGVDIWMYDPDLEQVTISKVASQLNNTPAVIFSGDLEQLNKSYRVTFRGGDQYRLRPIDSENSFQRLDLAFTDGVLSEMVILDSFGQLTEFRLRNVSPSDSLSLDEFQFVPPEGTDVFFNE